MTTAAYVAHFDTSIQIEQKQYSYSPSTNGILRKSHSSPVIRMEEFSSLRSDYEPPKVGLLESPEQTFTGSQGMYTGSIEYDDMNKQSTGKANRQKLFELKMLDAKLGRGHRIYFIAILIVLIAVVVSFILSMDSPMPLQLAIYRIVLVGFLLYVMLSAINALKNKKYSLQVLVVYFLKWYIALFSIYVFLGLIFIHHAVTPVTVGEAVEFIVNLCLLWTAVLVQQELKKREELIAEINFTSFFA